jgi:protein O-mannosyl-transferase
MLLPRKKETGREYFLAFSLLLLTTGLLYGHTLHVPFYMDDTSGLAQNFLLRDLPASLATFFGPRGLTRASLALNLYWSGLALPPLHLTNIAIHFANGVLVWLLLRRLLAGRWLPLCGALLFVAHPLQTQAVTYLIQRATLLGTFFFLLALLCYWQARLALAAGHRRRSAAYLLPYLGAVLAAGGALLAKENTATLPLVLFALDRLLPFPARRSRQEALLDYLPFWLLPLLAGLGALLTLTAGTEAHPIFYPLASLQHNGPLHYLVTQFSVFWIYLRLLLFPYGQALEHNYPIVAELLNWQNVLALAGLLTMGWLVWRVRRRRPLLAFGAAWMVLTLAVESSVIPLDPLFEHRLYLPMFGFVLVLLDGLPALLGKERAGVVLGMALLIWMPLTWQRNVLWNDPIAFYQDNLRTVPDSERAMMDLAFRYQDVGRVAEMKPLLERAVRLYPKNYEFVTALAELYADEHRLAPALKVLDDAIARMPDNVELYETAALIAEEHRRQPLIFTYLNLGLSKVSFGKWRLLNDLGIYYAQQGDLAQAETTYRQSLALYAENPAACQYLAALYFGQQRWREAFDLLQRAQRLEPGNPKTLEGLVNTARQLGDAATARWAAEKLEKATTGVVGGGKGGRI